MANRNVFVSELGTLAIDTEITEVTKKELIPAFKLDQELNKLVDLMNITDIQFRNGIKVGLEDLARTHNFDQIYLDNICRHVRELWMRRQHLPMILHYLEILRWLPANNEKINLLLEKLLQSDDSKPDRNVWAKIRILAKLQPHNIDLAVWLVEVVDQAGMHMAEVVMQFKEQFADSQILAYYFTEIAKLGSLDSVHRLANLLGYFKDSHINVFENMEIILLMIQSGKKVEAISTIGAMEESYTRPTNHKPSITN